MSSHEKFPHLFKIKSNIPDKFGFVTFSFFLYLNSNFGILQSTYSSYKGTLYKLYAVPVRVCIARESYHQYLWVISSVPVSLSSVPWGYAVLVSHIPSTHESYPQYLWVISSAPVSRIISTHESHPQYPWGYAVPVSYILSNCEDMHYLWVILDSFGQASEIKCPKLVTKNTSMIQKLEFTACPSETGSDSDSAEGTEDEYEVSASSVIYSSKNSWRPMANWKMN